MAKKADSQPPQPSILNPEPEGTEAQEATPKAQGPMPDVQPRARQSSAPFCPYHKKTRCVSRRSDQFFTRYYCPEEGCSFSIKIPRPRIRPAEEEQDFAAR